MLGDVVTDFEKSSIYIDYKLKSVSKVHSARYNKLGDLLSN